MKIRSKLILGFSIVIILTIIGNSISISQMNSMNDEIDRISDVSSAEQLLFDTEYMIHMMHHYLEGTGLDEGETRLRFEQTKADAESSLQYLILTYTQHSSALDDIKTDFDAIVEYIDRETSGIFDRLDQARSISETVHGDYPLQLARINGLIANETNDFMDDALEVKFHFERMIHLMHHYLEDTGAGVDGVTRDVFEDEKGQYDTHALTLLANSSLANEYLVFNGYVNNSFVPSLIDDNTGMFDLLDEARLNSEQVHVIFPDLIQNLSEFTDSLREEAKANANNAVEFAMIVQLIIGIASIVIALTVSYYITQSITGSLNFVGSSMKKGAAGNLVMNEVEENQLIDISSQEDEIGLLGSSYSSFLGYLRSIISETNNSVNILVTSSEEIVSGTEEINASSEEVASTSQAMSHGASTQTELINEVSEEIKQTTKLVDEIISSIRSNTNQVSQIALQTNILALNAGIEASRAGDYGRGFAVVAENIRKLSDQSKSASEGIAEVADEIALRLEEAFNKISSTMLNVVSVSEETAASAEEVAAAAEEMTATIEELASAAQELSTQSESSKEVIAQFQIDEKYLIG